MRYKNCYSRTILLWETESAPWIRLTILNKGGQIWLHQEEYWPNPSADDLASQVSRAISITNALTGLILVLNFVKFTVLHPSGLGWLITSILFVVLLPVIVAMIFGVHNAIRKSEPMK